MSCSIPKSWAHLGGTICRVLSSQASMLGILYLYCLWMVPWHHISAHYNSSRRGQNLRQIWLQDGGESSACGRLMSRMAFSPKCCVCEKYTRGSSVRRRAKMKWGSWPSFGISSTINSRSLGAGILPKLRDGRFAKKKKKKKKQKSAHVDFHHFRAFIAWFRRKIERTKR